MTFSVTTFAAILIGFICMGALAFLSFTPEERRRHRHRR
jgi:hypothetical protein